MADLLTRDDGAVRPGKHGIVDVVDPHAVGSEDHCRSHCLSPDSERSRRFRHPLTQPAWTGPAGRVQAARHGRRRSGPGALDAAGRRRPSVPHRRLAPAAHRVACRRPRRDRRPARTTSPAFTCATPRIRSIRRSSATTPSTATGWSTSSASIAAARTTAIASCVPTDSSPSRTPARPLWAGIAEKPEWSPREDGWGARGRMKDASSTDVVVHNGVALTSFYQCGDLYRLDPNSLETLGKADWHGGFPASTASRRTPRSTRAPANCSSSTTAPRRRTCATGWSTPTDTLVHYTDVPLPGPAAAPRHGLHRQLRDPQRLPAFLAARGARRSASTSRVSSPTCRPGSASSRGAGRRPTSNGSRRRRRTSCIG